MCACVCECPSCVLSSSIGRSVGVLNTNSEHPPQVNKRTASMLSTSAQPAAATQHDTTTHHNCNCTVPGTAACTPNRRSDHPYKCAVASMPRHKHTQFGLLVNRCGDDPNIGLPAPGVRSGGMIAAMQPPPLPLPTTTVRRPSHHHRSAPYTSSSLSMWAATITLITVLRILEVN